MKFAVVLLLLAASGAAKHLLITTDDEFESRVLQSSNVIVAVFCSSKAKGAAAERQGRCADMDATLQKISEGPPGVQVALVDVERAKAVGSEFNVKKRTVPKMMLFRTRARNGDELDPAANLVDQGDVDWKTIHSLLEAGENPKDDDTGRYSKITLALGGNADEL